MILILISFDQDQWILNGKQMSSLSPSLILSKVYQTPALNSKPKTLGRTVVYQS